MKTKAHTKYTNKNGQHVPGVTTILNLLSKPALLPWVARITAEGYDYKKYVDDKAAIGTLAHAICTDYLMNVPTDYSHYDEHQRDKAQNCALSFFNWVEKRKITPIIIEGQLVNEYYGGTVDIYADIDGRKELVDLKTGSGIWEEYLYQVSAYAELLRINGYPVDGVRVLNIPRAETEKFKEEEYSARELEVGLKIFNSCLEIYRAKKELK